MIQFESSCAAKGKIWPITILLEQQQGGSGEKLALVWNGGAKLQLAIAELARL